MAIDAGGHTGVAWGIFDTKVTTAEALMAGIDKGSDTITGLEVSQIKDLSRRWRQFFYKCVNQGCMPTESVELIVEDFVLRPGGHGGGKEGNVSQRIAWGLLGYRLGQADEFERAMQEPATVNQVIFQIPSAMSFATDKRLREWGLWVRGREHERDAWRHVAYRLHSIRGNV
jgi:ABC-type taurine transport system ATPase subunit